MINHKDKTIAVTWGVEDVQGDRPDLNDDQAWAVLRAVYDRHDANIGINWDFISAVADDLYPEGV